MLNTSQLDSENDPMCELRYRIDALNAAIAALEREREQLRIVWDCGSYFRRPARDGGGHDLCSN